MAGGPHREAQPDQSSLIVALGAPLRVQRRLDLFDLPSAGGGEPLERDRLARRPAAGWRAAPAPVRGRARPSRCCARRSRCS
jgi:hypothetical protein